MSETIPELPSSSSVAPKASTREEMMAQAEKMKERIQKMQKERPEQDLRGDQEWWLPGIEFSADVQERLDPETNAKYDATFKRMNDSKWAPEVVRSSLAEARSYLAGHDDLQERFDSTFSKPELFDQVHKYLVENPDAQFKADQGIATADKQ